MHFGITGDDLDAMPVAEINVFLTALAQVRKQQGG